MRTLLKLASLIETQNILNILNIALTVLFILVLGVLVLVFLRGLLRGWKYGTYRLISFAIMVTAVLATLGLQANALGDMDLQRFNIPNLNFALTIDGVEHAISVKWTTLQTSLEDLIIQVAEAFGANGSYSGMLSYASVLASSLIKLLLIFVWGLLLSTLGMLLIMLLWHIAFKRFTPRERRKIKKLRLVSAFEELLIGAACLGMLLSPFTSIVNSVNGRFKVEDERAKENETVSMITDILGVYDQSAFAKTFFSWNSMDGSTTFDQQLISFLTQSEVKEVKTDLISEISALANISAQAINAGLLSANGSEGIRWYLLLSSSSIPELIYALSETKLIQCALPFAVSLAVNLDAVKNVLGEETCKYLSDTDVDWAEVVQSMSRIYENILDAGIIDCVVDVENGSSTPVFDWTQLQYVFSGKDASGNDRDAKAAMHRLTEEFEDSTLFSHLMAGLLSQLGKAELEKESRADLSILDFLPLTEDEKDIDYEALVALNYTKEFNLLYDTIYSINDVSPEVVNNVLDLVQNPPSEETSQETYRNLLSLSAKYADDYVDLLVGERDESGEPKENSKDCLFDSFFVGNALPSMVTFIEKSGSTALDMDLKLTETKKRIEDEGWTIKDYKREFGATLDVAADFASSEAGLAFIEDGTGMAYKNGKLISIDPELVKALQNSLERSDDSLIMTEALPQVAEKYFEDFRDTLSEFGIKNIDFACEDFGHELSFLLNLISYSGDLILALNGIEGASAHLMATTLLEEKDTLVRVLDIFAGSKILNPLDAASGKRNTNIVSLLNYVFSSAGLEDFKLEDDALDGVSLVSERQGGDIGGEIVKAHENYLIVASLTSVPLTDLMSLAGSSGNEMMRALARIDIETLFKSIGESEVMRSVAGSAMDKYFTSVLEVGEEEGITFKNLTSAEDWAKEGATIKKIVDLATKGIDISDFDINKVSPTLARDLFSNLAKSQIFNKKAEDGSVDYKFPEFFSSKILGMLDDTSISYFADKGVNDLDVSDDLNARKEKCSTFVNNCLALKEVEDWTNDDEGGEIELFCKVLSNVQSLGGFSSLSSFSSDKLLLLRDTLNNLSSSDVFGSVLIANALSRSLDDLSSSMSSSSFDLSLANAEVFFDLDKESRVEQVGYLCDVMDTLYDPYYGLLGEDGQFQEDKMAIDKLNVDYCLRPLLEDISSSDVFTTKREGKNETLLRSFFKTILVKSNLYGEGLEKDDEISAAHAPGITISTLVDGVSDMDQEINVFCDVVKIVQESGLLSGGSIDLSSLDSSKLSAVKSLLEQINSSDLLYRALPIQIDKAVRGLSGLPASFQIDLELCDPFVMRNEGGTDYERYEDNEIACLANLLTSVSEYSDLGSASVSDLAKLDLEKTLSPLYASRVFNSRAAQSGEKKDLTSAQAFLTDILAQMGLDDLICSTSSPKDIKYGTETPSAKYKYLVSSTLGVGDEGNYKKYTLENQRSNAFYEVIGKGEGGLSHLLSNLNEHSLLSLLEGGEIDFATLTKSSSTLSSLLKDLSHCLLLKDVPINALGKYLSNGELTVDGLDLSLTNYYYPYFYDVENATATIDYSRGYDDSEIDLLVDLLDLIESNKDDLEDDRLDTIDPYLLRQFLWELDDSLLFHQTGVNQYSSTYNKGWENESYTPSAEAKVTSDLTVFEQVVYLVYKNSGLATRSFDAYHDFAYLVDAGYDESLAAELKLHGKIKALVLDSDWRLEIETLTTDDEGKSGLIRIAQESDLLTSEGKVDTSTEFLKKLSPGKAMELLRLVGRSRVCEDALATTIASFLTSGESGTKGLGVETFSTSKISLGTGDTFVSDSSFLENGLKYADLYFSSSTYDGTEDLTLMGDLDGDGTYETNLSSLVASSYDPTAKRWDFGLGKIGCDFIFTISKPGELSYMFDTAKYYLPYGSLEKGNKDSDALEWFLCSLRKTDGTYYSFEGSASALKEAYEAGVPLYGIASIVMGSSIYTESCFDVDFRPVSSATATFSSSAYSFYKMFSLEDTSSGVKVNLLDAVDAPKLAEKYGTSVPDAARYSSIDNLIKGSDDPFAEGKFFETALVGAEYSDIVHEIVSVAFSPSSEESTKTALYRYASSLLGKEENGYADFLSSSELDYSYHIDNEVDPSYDKTKASSTSVFAKHLIAGALNDRVEERISYAQLSSHALGAISLSSPSDPMKTRLTFLAADDQSLLASFDAYGYDLTAKTYSFANLSSLASSEGKGVAFTALLSSGISISSSSPFVDTSSMSLTACLLNSEQKTKLDGICGDFDAMNGIAKALVNLIYASDAYDYLVLKGSIAKQAYQNYFFHGPIDATLLTPAYGTSDFPCTFGDGLVNGVSTAFSYVTLANEIRMSA